MLIDKVVNHANYEYLTYDKCQQCKNCQNLKRCSGSCKKCMDDIHFPFYNKEGMKEYSCPNLINFYICNYSHKCASEILYLLRESKSISKLIDYKILSFGCGPCPDLMAFERYLYDLDSDKKISYIGVDKNELWEPSHKLIEEYESPFIDDVKFIYEDATEELFEKIIPNTNIIIFEYFLAYFYTRHLEDKIGPFFDLLIENIIKYRNRENPFIIIFNDVNSKKLGKGDFDLFYRKLKKNKLLVKRKRFYFRFGKYPRYGKAHEGTELLFPISDGLRNRGSRTYCMGAQSIIEIK